MLGSESRVVPVCVWMKKIEKKTESSRERSDIYSKNPPSHGLQFREIWDLRSMSSEG